MRLNDLNEWPVNEDLKPLLFGLGMALGGDAYAQNQQHATQEQHDDFANFTAKFEGFSDKVYKDSRGISTIGYGFNLQRQDAKDILNKHGLDIKKLLDGSQKMPKNIASNILTDDIRVAKDSSKKMFKNYNDLDKDVQMILVDLMYNLGQTKLSKFVKFKDAILTSNFKKASDELANSMWATQVGNRAKHHIDKLRSK